MSLAEPVPSPASAAPADVAHSPARPPWLRFDDVGLPVLPTVAQRVIELAGDPSASVATLANIVSKEQVLASRVLAYANSAQHCPLGNVSTVRTAIVRLGTGIVRGVVMAECFASRLYDPGTYGETGRALADHALGTAYTARLVAERVGIDLEEAFLCGLLHDVGKLVVLKLARDHERRSGRTLEREDVETAMTAHHAALGGLVLKKWRLPDALDEPVRFHHDYASAPTRRRETATLCLANLLSHRYGFGCPADDVNPVDTPVAAELGLDGPWLERMDARAPGLVEVARQIFA